MFPMTFVLYCDDKKLWHNVCRLLQAYGMFFFQLCIVLNTKDNYDLSDDFPEILKKRLTVVFVPGGLMMGSALNKMIPHLKTERFLLFDARYKFETNALHFLKSLTPDIYDNTQFVLSLHHRPEICHWALNWPPQNQSHTSHGVECRYVPLLSWGALFLSTSMLSRFGGFEQQLSYDAMMIDLSWRFQQESVILAETAKNQAITEFSQKIYLPTIKNKYYLLKKYFNIYPKWLRFFKNIFHNRFSEKAHTKLF